MARGTMTTISTDSHGLVTVDHSLIARNTELATPDGCNISVALLHVICEEETWTCL